MEDTQSFKEPKCQQCKTEMVIVGNWSDKEDDLALYQCPKCKTVVMKVLSL
jgi:hypothetical protein